VITTYSTTGLTVTPALAFTVVPGLTITATVPATSKVIVSSYGGVQTTSASVGGYSTVDVVLMIDGAFVANGAYSRVIAANSTSLVTVFEYWGFTTSPTVSAGSHTFTIQAAGTGASGSNTTATVGGDTNSVLQGELTVTFVKQ
jgi:hypothetical protein